MVWARLVWPCWLWTPPACMEQALSLHHLSPFSTPIPSHPSHHPSLVWPCHPCTLSQPPCPAVAAMQVRDLLEPLLQPWLPLLQQVLASGISLQVSTGGLVNASAGCTTPPTMQHYSIPIHPSRNAANSCLVGEGCIIIQFMGFWRSQQQSTLQDIAANLSSNSPSPSLPPPVTTSVRLRLSHPRLPTRHRNTLQPPSTPLPLLDPSPVHS